MKLRRLHIEKFKLFREPVTLEGFADGLNLFAAPNESGKSTVAEAIRAAFFERHRSSSVEHLRPWGEPSATPTVEIEFEIDGRHYQLTKAFLAKKRCELTIAGQKPLAGAAAEDLLANLLGFKFPGKGASAPEHMGIPGLLWIRQGTSHELADAVTYAADHLREVLGESLGDLTSSSGDSLLRAVETSRNELLTPTTGNPKGEYAAALQRKAELASQLADLNHDIATYQGGVDRLAGLRRDHQRNEQERPWVGVREQHRAALARLETAQDLETRQQAELSALQQWRTQAAALRSELEAFARDDAAVATRQQSLTQKAAAESAAQAEAQSWERRHADAAATDAQARQVLERVRAVASRAEILRAAAELDANLDGLTSTVVRAREERTRGARLLAEADALTIAPADLKRLRELAEALRDVGFKLEAAATTLEFDLADGKPVRLGKETIEGRARRTVVSQTEIHIDGIGRISVQPGGADIAALTAQRDGLGGELKGLLQKLLVANVAEADERVRQAAQRQQEAQASRKVLEALAPKGAEALEAELAARTARGGELRAALASLPPATAGDDELPDLPSAKAQAEHAASALGVCAADGICSS